MTVLEHDLERTEPMKFFVFSYNRGEYLENCVRSIEECAPGAEVTIFDDQSDNQATRVVLDRISSRHSVITCRPDLGQKHGGLYGNMQAALETLEGDDLVCFMQDDTQMVRPLEEADYACINDYFRIKPKLGFVSPAFIRGISLVGKDRALFDYDESVGLYFPRPGRQSAGIYYSDIFLSSAARLRAHGWQFEKGEPKNQLRAKKTFSPMGYMKCPFMMWLPNGTAYRGKQKTLAMRMAEKKRRCGFYPFKYLDAPAIERLRSCPATELPVAEHYLEPMYGNPAKPWVYDPMQRLTALKHLNRAELLARRLLRRVTVGSRLIPHFPDE